MKQTQHSGVRAFDGSAPKFEENSYGVTLKKLKLADKNFDMHNSMPRLKDGPNSMVKDEELSDNVGKN